MKSLRVYFIMALVWLVGGLSLVACSKKTNNGGNAQICQVGFIQQNGTCVYDPSNPGNGGGGGYPGQYGYSPNGTYQNGSQFRDFTMLVNGYTYRYYGSGENQLQVKVANANSSSATVQITTPQFVYGTASFSNANKFIDTETGKTGYEIYHTNPYYHKVGELFITSGIIESSTQVSYEFRYFRNTGGWTSIMTGVMRKGIDY